MTTHHLQFLDVFCAGKKEKGGVGHAENRKEMKRRETRKKRGTRGPETRSCLPCLVVPVDAWRDR